jgi:AcrR family transcriptional regulator
MSASLVDQTVDRALEGRRAAVTSEVRRLVEASLTLTQRSGEFEPTVGAIVREAGLSNQAFYRHFRSKRQLLVAVLDEGIRILASYLAHRMDAADSPEDRVREWIRGMLEQALDPRGAQATRPFALARGRLAEAFPEEVARSESQLTELLRQAICDAVAARQTPHADPERDAESLYHLTMGWVEARLLESGASAETASAHTAEGPQVSELNVESSSDSVGEPVRKLVTHATETPSSSAEPELAGDERKRADAARLEAFAIAGLRRHAPEVASHVPAKGQA